MPAAEDLARTLAGQQVTTRVRPGIVVADDAGALGVNVDGALVRVLWPVGAIFAPGDVVRVLTSPDGYEILPPVLTAPRPATGTVAGSAAAGLVPVTTTAGDVQARYTGTAPSIGTAVRLDWSSTQPWVLPGAAAPVTTTPPLVTAPPAPPPLAQMGVLQALAVDSGSWAVHRGAWSTTTGSDVLQGTWAGATYTGAWWYGAQLTQLRGRTPRSWRVWVPARRPGVGDHGTLVVLDVYVHEQAVRGTTEPARVLGPWSLTLPITWPGGWATPPTSFVQRLINTGGGLAIAGTALAGVAGIATDPRTGRPGDPRSGRVEIEWSRQ